MTRVCSARATNMRRLIEQYDDAELLYQAALSELEGVHATDPARLVSLYLDLVELFKVQKKLTEANNMCELAHSLMEATKGNSAEFYGYVSLLPIVLSVSTHLFCVKMIYC